MAFEESAAGIWWKWNKPLIVGSYVTSESKSSWADIQISLELEILQFLANKSINLGNFELTAYEKETFLWVKYESSYD